MDHENTRLTQETSRSYECDGCGECFDTLERLRQHEVDCKDDDFEQPC